ncbi:MAG: TAXI family TRAP transporter solute-binding subunit [Bacillota bacterium]
MPNHKTCRLILSIGEGFLGLPFKFISIDEEKRDSLVEKHALKKVTIPAGTYNGQDYDVQTVGMPCVLFTRDDVSEEVIYNLTKKLVEEKEYLSKVHVLFEEFKPEEAWQNTGIELHPGAEKYYKEAGLME